MQTFTARQLRFNTSKVFEAVDKDGEVRIEHGHYKGRSFLLKEITKPQDNKEDE